jgi:GTPase Era involved in 16S rRNA processing
MPTDRNHRTKRRLERRQKKAQAKALTADSDGNKTEVKVSDERFAKFAKLLSQNEDDLVNFVADINKLFQDKLGKPAPFVTFVICGMQSSGKSTIMERFMNAPLNIVQEGTGTRCPLDTTCIHDGRLSEPICELSGKEFFTPHTDLTIEEAFVAITEHNRALASKDTFSSEPLRLVYRASNVQNMRFVDTPGIIANKGTGQDNRESIKQILRDTMKKPNSKLCVLVEPKEFSTNAIIDFCDETFKGKEDWKADSIVIMSKFDKQLEDSRSGSKANKFFGEYHDVGIYPYLAITPTLDREDLDPDQLFEMRKKLLQEATSKEEEKFEAWISGHARYRETDPDDPKLSAEVSSRIGFSVAKDKMREVMLLDTATRLPEVLRSIMEELSKCRSEKETLEGKRQFRDPNYLKRKVGDLLQCACKRVGEYLDGDLEAAVKFPDSLMDLDDELEQEEDSEWAGRTLGSAATVEDEEKWRDLIQTLIEREDGLPDYVYAEKKYIGGKQFQRATKLMKTAMLGELE